MHDRSNFKLQLDEFFFLQPLMYDMTVVSNDIPTFPCTTSVPQGARRKK
jgi:hypothetical protein